MGIRADLRKPAVLFVSTLTGLAIWRFLKAPPPEEDLAYLESAESRVETFQTEDGVTLRLKRYVNEGAQPILLAHGFTGNGLEFDLPHRGHNLALYLREHGYDVWISSFRGCGVGPHECGINHWGHSVDELAALDAPALVKGITEATGRKPIWIGHSMGGLVLYMYLQGAKPASGNGRRFRVATDPETARERNDSILGGITIGSPPGLHRGGGDWIADLERLPFYRTTSGLLVRLLERISEISGKVPVSRLRDIAGRCPRLGRLLATHGPIATALYNTKNVDPDVGRSLLKWGSDNVSARMTAQIVMLAVDPDFKGYHGECNYTANMHWITAPVFFITGSEDFVGPDNVREYGHERVSSERKRFKYYEGYGHTDLVMGKRVLQEVYPDILAWVEELSG